MKLAAVVDVQTRWSGSGAAGDAVGFGGVSGWEMFNFLLEP